jgi:hypothetical protein
MKSIFIAGAFILFSAIVHAQNVGIGTTTPSEKLTISSGNISLLSSSKGILLNGVDGPMINRGFDPFISGNYTGLGRWGLFMEPNNLTLGIPAIGLKAFAVSSYKDNSTIVKQLFRVSLDAVATNALVEVNGEMKIEGLNTVEFGAGVTKEFNAGKIGYQTFTADALDIVGAGTTIANRKVNIFAEGGTTFNGQLKITGGAPAAGKVLTSDASGLASWQNIGQHTIGESYGGGIVFYVYDNGQHGLIAATADQSAGIQWYNGTYIMCNAVRNDGISTGRINTDSIIAKQGGGNYAAAICAKYLGGGFGDWFGCI